MTGENWKKGKTLYGSKSTLHFHLITMTMWIGSFSLMVITLLVYHTIHYFVLGQCHQFILVSPTCLREVIQFKLHPLQYRKPSFS